MTSDRPWFATAFAAVTVARLSLRFLGFRRTMRAARWYGHRVAGRPARGAPERMARGIAVAAAFFPGRAICLEQSVALYLLLRRWGHDDAALRVGVQPYPFLAHAWVELAGRPLLENDDDMVKFVAFPEAFA